MLLQNILGWLGAILIGVAFLPQTYKLFKTKNTTGLSLTCYLIYHIGLSFFIIYASFTIVYEPYPNYPLLVGNIFGWIINFYLLFLICYNIYNASDKKKKNGPSNATY